VDYEYYSWTNLDPSKEETKELVKQYFGNNIIGLA